MTQIAHPPLGELRWLKSLTSFDVAVHRRRAEPLVT
jgi:hypothetical protein